MIASKAFLDTLPIELYHGVCTINPRMEYKYDQTGKKLGKTS